jgi:hypothetical protein
LILALLVMASPVRAQVGGTLDFQYVGILNLIERGDTLVERGQTNQALAKYQESLTKLQEFREHNPAWNVKVISYRLNYLAEKVRALTKPAAPAPSASETAPAGLGSKPSAPVPAGAPAVKLLNAGAEPRQALRLHPSQGDMQKVALTMTISMDMGVGDMPGQAMKLPAMTMVMDVTVNNVTPEGDISYQMVLSDMSVAAGENDMMAEAMKAGMGNVKGLTTVGTMSDRGISKSMNVKSTGAGQEMGQYLDQMHEAFAHVSTPFPEEAIGPGAKWQVMQKINSQGMILDQTATYEMVSVEGDRAELKISITQQAANQKIENPAMPGLKVDLVKMSSKGSGTVTMDLAKVVPPSADVDTQTEMSMAMNMGDQKQAMNMKMDMNLRMESQ